MVITLNLLDYYIRVLTLQTMSYAPDKSNDESEGSKDDEHSPELVPFDLLEEIGIYILVKIGWGSKPRLLLEAAVGP